MPLVMRNTMDVSKRPLKRLSMVSPYPFPVVWGFLISRSHMMKAYNDSLAQAQLEKQLTFSERTRFSFRFFDKYHHGIIKECKKIYDDSADIHVTSIVVTEGPPRFVVAFFVCTRPDNSILPPQDKIDELTKVAGGFGFEWEPHWHMKNTD